MRQFCTALHTPFPSGDPALFSQPKPQKAVLPPPAARPAPSPNVAVLQGKGSGPDRGRSRARRPAPRPIREGPQREPAGLGRETAQVIFPFSATSNHDVSPPLGLRLDACVFPAEGRGVDWLRAQGAGLMLSLPPPPSRRRGRDAPPPPLLPPPPPPPPPLPLQPLRVRRGRSRRRRRRRWWRVEDRALFSPWSGCTFR